MRPSLFALALALVVSGALPACAMDGSQTDGDDQVSETDDELTLTTGKFETFTGTDGRIYFHLLAGNGEKVLGSQGYATVSAAVNAISVIQSGVTYELRTATNGETYFVAKSANGAVVATGETYASASNAERGLATVRKIVARTTSVLAAPSGAQFQVIRGLSGAYYFHLRAKNGEIVLASQSYSSRASAVNGVTSVQGNGRTPSRFEILENNGAYHFVLKAGNGAVIAHGENYVSKYNAERAVNTIVALLTGF